MKTPKRAICPSCHRIVRLRAPLPEVSVACLPNIPTGICRISSPFSFLSAAPSSLSAACFTGYLLHTRRLSTREKISRGGGVTSFVGATLFQVGAVLLAFEACNENQAGLLRMGSTACIRRRRDGRAGRMTRYIHRSRTGEESPWMPTSPPPPAPEGAVHAPSAGTSLVLGLTRRG